MNITDITINDNNAWFYAEEYSAICRMDLTTGKISAESLYNPQKKDRSRGIIYYRGKLILAPHNEGGNTIRIFDLESREYSEMIISNQYMPDKPCCNLFTEVISYQNRIFFLPGRYHAIVCIDMDTEKITYIDEWYDKINNFFAVADNGGVIFNDHFPERNPGHILLRGHRIGVVMDFCLTDHSWRIKELGINRKIMGYVDSDIGYLESFFDEEDALYLCKDSRYKKILSLWGRMVSYKDRVYIAAYNQNVLYELDVNSMDVREIYSGEKVEEGGPNFFLFKQMGSKLVANSILDSKLIIYDMENRALRTFKLYYPEEIYFNKIRSSNVYVYENEGYTLERYLSWMCKK